MKRLTLMFTLATVLAVVVPLGGASGAGATHAPGVHGSLTRSWGAASFSAYRRGWGASLSVSVSDTARDHDAVYLKAELDVADGFDPDMTVLRVGGVGTTLRDSEVLKPGARWPGTAIRGVRFTLCKDDAVINDDWLWGRLDTCVDSPWYALPPHGAHHAGLRSGADDLMNGHLSDFLAEKASETSQPSGCGYISHPYCGDFPSVPGYDWTDDGCSNPVLPSGLKDRPTLLASFWGACARHDFGYRNYGKYTGLQLGPTDGTKAWIDNIFLRDLRAACGLEPTCLTWAEAYYQAVRQLAGADFYAR